MFVFTLTNMLNVLPPPNGAQMTRLMALTQSSMSFWEFAISKKASWLGADRSFSPVPPTGKRTESKSERKTGLKQARGLMHVKKNI